MNNFENLNQSLLNLLTSNSQIANTQNLPIGNLSQIGLNYLMSLQYQEMMKKIQTYQILQSNAGTLNLSDSLNKNLQSSEKLLEIKIRSEEKIREINTSRSNEDLQITAITHEVKKQENSFQENAANDINSCEYRVKSEDSSSNKKVKCQFITEKDEGSADKPKFFRCHFHDCDKIFPKESNLNDHLRTHTGEKPYKCTFDSCGRCFSQLGNLRKHDTVHIGEKAFYCEFPGCGKGFSAMYNLKIHSRSHSGEKPYKCTIEGCQREFYDKGNLRYHEKTSHSYEIKNLPFSCDHIGCNLKFKTKKQKLIHHHNLEPDCKNEKHSIIKALALFKKFTHTLIEKYNIDKDLLNEDPAYQDLRANYEELEKKLLDPDFFFFTVGENFDEVPK